MHPIPGPMLRRFYSTNRNRFSSRNGRENSSSVYCQTRCGQLYNIGKISEEIVVSYKCLLSVDCTYYTYCACVHTSVAVQCAWTFTTYVLTFSYTMFTIVYKGECVSVHTYTQCVEIKCGSQGRDCSCKYPDSASFWQP